MSLKTFIKKVEAEAGIEGQLLVSHIDEAKNIVNNIKAVLENPEVDSLLSVVTKGASDAVLPQVEALLGKISVDLTIGTAIAADIAAVPDTESKLKVFITDLSKYGVVNKDMFLQKICSLLLAGLDDNVLKQNLYDLYSQAEYTLTHKAA